MQDQLFHEYFENWIETYKCGAIAKITLDKYFVILTYLKKMIPELKLRDITKRSYQTIINEYAETHERQTVIDFHNRLKASILDAIDEGFISNNPIRKIVIKGKEPRTKKQKYLSIAESQKLVTQLDLITPIRNVQKIKFDKNGRKVNESRVDPINWDWLILICLKTGMRYAEVLGLTPADFDFKDCTINVSKTWNYKDKVGHFSVTKNKQSVRKIKVDKDLMNMIRPMLTNITQDEPIFVIQGRRIFNSTANHRFTALCKKADIPTLSIHGLRHTHGSILLAQGVSLFSISKRLGHSDVATTQTVYMHIIKELEEKDNNKITQALEEFDKKQFNLIFYMKNKLKGFCLFILSIKQQVGYSNP